MQGEEQLADIIARSHNSENPIVIFKHSTRCGISSAAKKRVENSDAFTNDVFSIYYLDLLAHRDISNKIAETFQVQHESPQILFIKNGKCVYHTSHGEIGKHNFAQVEDYI